MRGLQCVWTSGRPPFGTALCSLTSLLTFVFFLSVSVALLLLHVAPPPPLSSLRSPSTHSTPPLSALHSFALSLSFPLSLSLLRLGQDRHGKKNQKRDKKEKTRLIQENISLNMFYKTFEDRVIA